VRRARRTRADRPSRAGRLLAAEAREDLDYAKRQEFPLLPDASDPDAGNVYRTLQFPEHVYEHIGEYREAKASASG